MSMCYGENPQVYLNNLFFVLAWVQALIEGLHVEWVR